MSIPASFEIDEVAAHRTLADTGHFSRRFGQRLGSVSGMAGAVAYGSFQTRCTPAASSEKTQPSPGDKTMRTICHTGEQLDRCKNGRGP